MISKNIRRTLAAHGAANKTAQRVQRHTHRAIVVPVGQPIPMPPAKRSRMKRAGLSLVEMLMALAITAMLLTATMVAIDASFKAYAAAAESASTQTATRMVVNRLLTLVRTSTAHEPMYTSNDADWPVDLVDDDRPDTLESKYITLIDPKGQRVRIEYREGKNGARGALWILTAPDAAAEFDTEQELLTGVSAARFYTHVRSDRDGVLVLDRGTIDITVEADEDTTLAIESDRRQPIRAIASTMPRKVE